MKCWSLCAWLGSKMGAEVKIEGFDDLARKLRELVPAMRKRVLRNALSAGARLVRDDAKRRAPVLSASAKAPYRTPGTLKKAIRVRSSKQARRAGDVGVFVNVKPAKGIARGAKSGADPFYWRFLEFGTRKMPARSFLKPASEKLNEALGIFQTQVGRWIEKTNATGKITP
jgi:HK97 gp10 family phage protein